MIDIIQGWSLRFETLPDSVFRRIFDLILYTRMMIKFIFDSMKLMTLRSSSYVVNVHDFSLNVRKDITAKNLLRRRLLWTHSSFLQWETQQNSFKKLYSSTAYPTCSDGVYPICSDIFKSPFKTESWKLERLFWLKRIKRKLFPKCYSRWDRLYFLKLKAKLKLKLAGLFWLKPWNMAKEIYEICFFPELCFELCFLDSSFKMSSMGFLVSIEGRVSLS